jgi:hypothetical protein
VSGVSRHAARVFFGFNLTCKTFFFRIRQYGRDVDVPSGKAGKILKQANSETIGAVDFNTS